jgi:hypothetical protein
MDQLGIRFLYFGAKESLVRLVGGNRVPVNPETGVGFNVTAERGVISI